MWSTSGPILSASLRPSACLGLCPPSPSLSGRYLSYHITCVLCVLLIVSTIEHERQLVRLASFGCLGMAGTAVYAVIQRIQGVEVSSSTVDLSLNVNMPGRVYSFYENSNAYAEMLLLLIPVAIALLFGARAKRYRLIGLFSALLGCAAILMTYSRASWIGLAAAAVVFVFLWNRKLLPACIVLGLACIPFLPASILNRILTIFNPNDSSTSSRLPLYEAAVKGVMTSPVTGAGLGADAVRQFIKEYGLYHGRPLSPIPTTSTSSSGSSTDCWASLPLSPAAGMR